MKRSRLLQASSPRGGYTLIEILIVVGILVILLTMTLMAVRFTRDGDRVTAAAAQVQSFLGGARDRAIYARAPRGVRMFLDPQNPRALSSMVYIDPSATWSDGKVRLHRWDPDLDGRTNLSAGDIDINQDGTAPLLLDDPRKVWMVVGEGTAWWELKRRGLLFDGMRIRIPKGPTGSWYPINTQLIKTATAPTNLQILVLAIPYRDPGNTPVEGSQAFASGGPEDYEIELAPRILPGEPATLPEGTVIDLDASQLANPALARYVGYIDFVYSPRGGLTGESATVVNHLYVCNREDSLILKEAYVKANPSGLPPRVFIPLDSLDPTTVPWAADIAAADAPYNVQDRRIVTISGQTGGVSIHPVEAASQDPQYPGLANDPFYYAETGETAK